MLCTDDSAILSFRLHASFTPECQWQSLFIFISIIIMKWLGMLMGTGSRIYYPIHTGHLAIQCTGTSGITGPGSTCGTLTPNIPITDHGDVKSTDCKSSLSWHLTVNYDHKNKIVNNVTQHRITVFLTCTHWHTQLCLTKFSSLLQTLLSHSFRSWLHFVAELTVELYCS